MSYNSPIVGGGGALIRDSIRSRNYVAGTSGWAIFADGVAELVGAIIRGTLQSSNYVAGTSGWKLDQSGTAELVGATIRGTLQSSNYVAGSSGWKLNEAGTAELLEASIRGTLQSSNYVSGSSGWELGEAGTAEIVDLRVNGTTDLTLGSTAHAFQIGVSSGPNLAADVNEIMARNNGQSAALALQAQGGWVVVPHMRAVRSNDAGPRTSASGSYTNIFSAEVRVPTGLPGNGPSTSKTLVVHVSSDLDNDTATGLTRIGFEVREGSGGGPLLVSGNDGLAGMNQGTARCVSGRTVAVTVSTTAIELSVTPVAKVSAGTGTYVDTCVSAWASL